MARRQVGVSLFRLDHHAVVAGLEMAPAYRHIEADTILVLAGLFVTASTLSEFMFVNKHSHGAICKLARADERRSRDPRLEEKELFFFQANQNLRYCTLFEI